MQQRTGPRTPSREGTVVRERRMLMLRMLVATLGMQQQPPHGGIERKRKQRSPWWVPLMRGVRLVALSSRTMLFFPYGFFFFFHLHEFLSQQKEIQQKQKKGGKRGKREIYERWIEGGKK